MRSIEQTKLLDDVLSRILIPYIYTICMLLARKIFHEENFLQGKFFPVTLMYSFRFYSIDYVAVIPTPEKALLLYIDRCDEMERPCQHKHIEAAANSIL